MITSSTRPRSSAWAAILALAMETSLSPAIAFSSAIPRSTLPAKVMVVHLPASSGRWWVTTTTGAPTGVPVSPAAGVVEQAPSAHQGAGARQGLQQQLRAVLVDLERPAFIGAGHGHRARLIPAEQLRDIVAGVGDETVH